MIKYLLIFIVFFGSCTNCSLPADNSINEISISQINDLKNLNNLILRNLDLLTDSCSNNTICFNQSPIIDVDSNRCELPATWYLLEKYLPKNEKEKFLDIKSKIENAQSVCSNVSFRIDSTVIYNFDSYTNCYDSLINHHIVYQTSPNILYEKATIINSVEFEKNWTYYIIGKIID